MTLTADGLRVRDMLRIEYDALVDAGLLEGQPVELIEGAVVEVWPQGDPHQYVVRRLNRVLSAQVVDPWTVIIQAPFPAGDRSEPEPDAGVVLETGTVQKPDVAALLVEVMVTSRRLDLVVKPRVYGAAGVPVYAVVDVEARVLRVHTGPTADGYDEKRALAPGEPLVLSDPDLRLDVGDVLPPL